jgi:tetratricopeptide (TPR) repeat protein
MADMSFDDLVAHGWERARRDAPEATVTYFAELLAERPDDPRGLYEYASALDFADREADAAPLYERALAIGLAGEEERRALAQYGSTLRNVGRHQQAVAVLDDARRRFPDDLALAAFHALALSDAGRAPEAVADLIELAIEHAGSADLSAYAAPLRRYADELRR